MKSNRSPQPKRYGWLRPLSRAAELKHQMVDPSAAPDPPPGFPNPPRDRLEFWVRVIFGALFGVFFSEMLCFVTSTRWNLVG